MALDPGPLESLAVAFLERQPWYVEARRRHGEPQAGLGLLELEPLAGLPAAMARLVLGAGEQRFQLVVGWRPATDAASVLRGREGSLLGPLRDGGSEVLAYDALADTELALALLAVATDGAERAERVRVVGSLVSHASLVYDERLFMKCYRVLQPGTRPEVEVLFALDEAGFNAMLAPVARWRGSDYDLALVREFVADGLEGRELARTSLRDLLARARELEAGGDATQAASSAGGDLAAEMSRLGSTTGQLHVALAGAFGAEAADPAALAARIGAPALPEEGLGGSIRLHGDYHLRRVMRSEAGWLVAGFGDDPLYGDEVAAGSLALRFGTPLEDLADMCFAIAEVAGEAVASRPALELPAARELAGAWVQRNRHAFLTGYRSVERAAALLPGDDALAGELLDALVELRTRREAP